MAPDPSDTFKANNIENNNVNINLQFFNGISSSDEDSENYTTTHEGYQLLTDEPPIENTEEIDYSSLSGIMTALENNGPNVIREEQFAEEDQYHSSEIDREALSDDRQQPIPVELDRERELATEAAALWNNARPSTAIIMDKQKEEEIKSAMSTFSLPPSAVPSWARNLSDEDWKANVHDLLSSVKINRLQS